jgi:Fe-S cluster biosynthesis and repair protein YggX
VNVTTVVLPSAGVVLSASLGQRGFGVVGRKGWLGWAVRQMVRVGANGSLLGNR